MEYNTTLDKLKLPEYGRIVQNMVNYAITIEDRSQRQQCAESIIKIMARINPQQKDNEEKLKMLWDHLAIISDYKLDVDSPYPITIISADDIEHPHLDYPHKPVTYRHYGSTLERMITSLPAISDEQERYDTTLLVVSQMAKCLALWNRNVLTPQKLADDLYELSDGKVILTAPQEVMDNIVNAALIIQKPQPTKKKKHK